MFLMLSCSSPSRRKMMYCQLGSWVLGIVGVFQIQASRKWPVTDWNADLLTAGDNLLVGHQTACQCENANWESLSCEKGCSAAEAVLIAQPQNSFIKATCMDLSSQGFPVPMQWCAHLNTKITQWAFIFPPPLSLCLFSLASKMPMESTPPFMTDLPKLITITQAELCSIKTYLC